MDYYCCSMMKVSWWITDRKWQKVAVFVFCAGQYSGVLLLLRRINNKSRCQQNYLPLIVLTQKNEQWRSLKNGKKTTAVVIHFRPRSVYVRNISLRQSLYVIRWFPICWQKLNFCNSGSGSCYPLFGAIAAAAWGPGQLLASPCGEVGTADPG